MKILMTTTSFPLYEGHTAGVFVSEQAKFLVKAGVEVDILAPMGERSIKKESVDGVNIKRFNYFWPLKHQGLCYGAGIPDNLKKGYKYKIQLPFLVFFFFLNILIFGRKADILYGHWTLSGLAAVMAGKLLKKPVVVMIHHGQNKFGKFRLLEKIPIEFADHVVFNSNFTQRKVLNFFKPRSFSIIPPGVDTDLFKPSVNPDDDFFMENYGLTKDTKLVFAMGRHINWKGYTYLIKAFNKLKKQNVILILAGSGPETENLKNQVVSSGLTESVLFIGNIPNHLTSSFYNRASVFIQPSIIDSKGNTEGLGVVLLEALACGTPVIGGNSGGIPDIIEDNVNGFLINPKNIEVFSNKILLALNNGKFDTMSLREMIERKFSWFALTQKNIFLIKRLIKRNKEN